MDSLSTSLASVPPPAALASDVSTLSRALARGDEAAYRAFHAAYFDRLLRYLLVVTRGDEQASRDALQAAFLRVVRHIRAFDDEAAFWSWLTVLARSALADQRRGLRRYLAFLDRFTRHSAAANDPGPAPAPSSSDPGAPLRVLLDIQLGLLPADERELLEWKYRENQSVRTIAARLATTEKAVESRLARLRAKLRDAVLAEWRATSPHPDEIRPASS